MFAQSEWGLTSSASRGRDPSLLYDIYLVLNFSCICNHVMKYTTRLYTLLNVPTCITNYSWQKMMPTSIETVSIYFLHFFIKIMQLS